MAINPSKGGNAYSAKLFNYSQATWTVRAGVIIPRLLEMQNEINWDRLGKSLDNAKPIKASITAYRAYVLCGLLQFSLRNPLLRSAAVPYEVARTMLDSLTKRLGQIDPYIAEVIEMGWDEKLDVLISEVKSGGCKYGDLDKGRKMDVIANGVALAIAFEKIAQLTGRSADEVSEQIEDLANEQIESWNTLDLDRTIEEIDQDSGVTVMQLRSH